MQVYYEWQHNDAGLITFPPYLYYAAHLRGGRTPVLRSALVHPYVILTVFVTGRKSRKILNFVKRSLPYMYGANDSDILRQLRQRSQRSPDLA